MKFIAIHNLYGIVDGSKAFFKNVGVGCFEFVNNPKFASSLTEEECHKILAHSEWYCKQYRASHMNIEEIDIDEPCTINV